MQRINLKEHVRNAIGVEWARFAADHPHLARVLDRDLLVEQVTASIIDSPEYQKALADAASAETAATHLAGLVQAVVRRVLALAP